MKYFLRIKNWQLFAIIVVPPIVLDMLQDEIASRTPNLLNSLTLIISGGFFFLWLLSIGVTVRKEVLLKVGSELLRFKVVFYYVILYLLLSVILLDLGFPLGGFVWIAFHIVCAVALLLTIIDCAMVISYLENGKGPSKILWYFILIWFFPIGVWIIQPKLNKISNGRIIPSP